MPKLSGPTITTIENYLGQAAWHQKGDLAIDPFYLCPEGTQGLIKNDFISLISQFFILNLTPNRDDLELHEVIEFVRKRVEVSEIDLGRLGQLVFRIRRAMLETRSTRQVSLSQQDLGNLLEACNGRCAICRYLFSSTAIDSILSGQKFRARRCFKHYDYLRPARQPGLELPIEVDHIQPISFLGTNQINNLQLLCGYCNRVKREYFTVFDRFTQSLKVSAIPHPFVVLRLLASHRCQKCVQAGTDEELTVSVIDPEVAPILGNLRVNCIDPDHDPFISRWKQIPSPAHP